jgi:hypothetical protein
MAACVPPVILISPILLARRGPDYAPDFGRVLKIDPHDLILKTRDFSGKRAANSPVI